MVEVPNSAVFDSLAGDVVKSSAFASAWMGSTDAVVMIDELFLADALSLCCRRRRITNHAVKPPSSSAPVTAPAIPPISPLLSAVRSRTKTGIGVDVKAVVSSSLLDVLVWLMVIVTVATNVTCVVVARPASFTFNIQMSATSSVLSQLYPKGQQLFSPQLGRVLFNSVVKTGPELLEASYSDTSHCMGAI